MGFLDTIAKAAPGLSVVGGVASGVANLLGAREQRRAASRAAGLTERELRRIRADAAPFREIGLSSLSRLAAENLVPLEETPDFQFIREQGERALERSAAARGKLLSGEAVRDAMRFGTGLASQQAGNRRQTLATLAGFGPGATSTTAGAGLISGGRLADLALQRGAANASSFAAPVNAFSSTINDLIGQAALRGAFT